MHFLPRQWLPAYERSFAVADLVAGLTLSTVMIPQGMAYARLAGLPPYIGLYTSLVPVAAYCFFGTSRHMSAGSFAVISLLVGETLDDLCPGVRADHMTCRLASKGVLTMCVGACLVLFGFTRLGTLFFRILTVSEPLVTAFVCGSAFQIATSQVWK